MNKLLLSLLFAPSIVFASGGDPSFELFKGLLIIAVACGVFWVARTLFLWYWKIDTIISNQEKTNLLLNKMITELKSKKEIIP